MTIDAVSICESIRLEIPVMLLIRYNFWMKQRDADQG